MALEFRDPRSDAHEDQFIDLIKNKLERVQEDGGVVRLEEDYYVTYDDIGYGHWIAFSANPDILEDVHDKRVKTHDPRGYGMVSKYKVGNRPLYVLYQSRTCR